MVLAWSTDEPTTAEGMVRWCSADGTEAVSPFSSGPAREHRVAAAAPDPSAIGWGYVVVSGASVPYAPILFTVPPDSAASDLPADAPEPFVAPVTTRYIITVSPRTYGYGITASCAHHPYIIGLGGLYPPAPVITGPAEDSRVAPLNFTVSWTFTAPDGSTQVGYRIQVASDGDFEHLVADQSVESTAGSHVLDLPSCGEHFARVKVLTDRNQWSAWSETVAFPAELATITAYPDTYCATELGPGKDAYFSVAVLQPCDVAWKVADRNGHAVYTGSRSLMPGEHTLTWPGVLVASSEYPMPFSVVLAPPGRYVFIIAARDPAHPSFYSFNLVEFSVTW